MNFPFETAVIATIIGKIYDATEKKEGNDVSHKGAPSASLRAASNMSYPTLSEVGGSRGALRETNSLNKQHGVATSQTAVLSVFHFLYIPANTFRAEGLIY